MTPEPSTKDTSNVDTQNGDTSCAARVEASMLSTLADLKAMYRPCDCSNEELQSFCDDNGVDYDLDDSGFYGIADSRCDYGLCFDFVQPEEGNGYWRYQFSTGGPGTELRLYGMANGQLHKAEYWLLDWFDGAHCTLAGDALETARVIFQDFAEMDVLQSTYDEAMG